MRVSVYAYEMCVCVCLCVIVCVCVGRCVCVCVHERREDLGSKTPTHLKKELERYGIFILPLETTNMSDFGVQQQKEFREMGKEWEEKGGAV